MRPHFFRPAFTAALALSALMTTSAPGWAIAAAALLGASLVNPSGSHAQERARAAMPEQHQNQTQRQIMMLDTAACRIPLQITEEAERQPGGAQYAAATGQAGMMAQGKPMAGMNMEAAPGGGAMAGMKMDDAQKMEGAHVIHESQQGGAFFMAPNKLNHVEALYCDDCGFRVVFFNILTQHIRADSFRAMIMVIPDALDEPELNRFLYPTQDGEVLSTAFGDEVSRPFEVQLYIEFPESLEPELFTVRVQ
jgi:hypothetical protein